MVRMLDIARSRGRDVAAGRDRRRERHRQGARRARAPRSRAAQGRRRSSRSTAARSPSRCSRASCSATSAARSPAPIAIAAACSRSPTAARCSSTRSPTPARAMQAKLLRVLQDGMIRRVGDTTTRKVDVRVIAATQHALAELAAAGRFREDLRFRLEVITVPVPPLRERDGDLPLLVEHLLARLCPGAPVPRLTRAALRALGQHRWPGQRARARERARARRRDGRRRDRRRRSSRGDRERGGEARAGEARGRRQTSASSRRWPRPSRPTSRPRWRAPRATRPSPRACSACRGSGSRRSCGGSPARPTSPARIRNDRAQRSRWSRRHAASAIELIICT